VLGRLSHGHLLSPKRRVRLSSRMETMRMKIRSQMLEILMVKMILYQQKRRWN
jgi:hypothetical protein